MQYVENKLELMEAYTIQVKRPYNKTTSMKIYRTAKAAQKAADKAKTKDGEPWEVLPLNLSYTEQVEKKEDNDMLLRAKKYLPEVIKHLEKDSAEVESFSMGIHDRINVLRWQPNDGTEKIKRVSGDVSLVVEVTLKYTVDM